jgi:hypothetical protein
VTDSQEVVICLTKEQRQSISQDRVKSTTPDSRPRKLRLHRRHRVPPSSGPSEVACLERHLPSVLCCPARARRRFSYHRPHATVVSSRLLTSEQSNKTRKRHCPRMLSFLMSWTRTLCQIGRGRPIGRKQALSHGLLRRSANVVAHPMVHSDSQSSPDYLDIVDGSIHLPAGDDFRRRRSTRDFVNLHVDYTQEARG